MRISGVASRPDHFQEEDIEVDRLAQRQGARTPLQNKPSALQPPLSHKDAFFAPGTAHEQVATPAPVRHCDLRAKAADR